MKWNLFKKDKKMTWMDVSYKQFKKIQGAKVGDKVSIEAIMQAIYGDDVLFEPMIEYNKKMNLLTELMKSVPQDLTVNTVKINGHSYVFDGLLGHISAAQYMDYNNWLKVDSELKSFSCFFIPKGHKYNDGYDMEEVFKDLEDFPIPILYSATFFFKRQLELFIKIFQRSLEKSLKKVKKMDPQMKKVVEETLKVLDSLAFFHLS